MSNTITIELCTEDRARLDRLIEAMERRNCDECVAAACKAMKSVAERTTKNTEAPESLTNAPGAKEDPKAETTPPGDEKPKEEPPAPSASTSATAIGRNDLRNKVITLSAAGKKAQAVEVIRQYAEKVTAVPEDKIAECYDKLVALEG